VEMREVVAVRQPGVYGREWSARQASARRAVTLQTVERQRAVQAMYADAHHEEMRGTVYGVPVRGG